MNHLTEGLIYAQKHAWVFCYLFPKNGDMGLGNYKVKNTSLFNFARSDQLAHIDRSKAFKLFKENNFNEEQT